MKTATLKGRFTTDLLDTATAETTPLKGKVILQAQYKALLSSESGDPTTVIPSFIEIELGSEGRLPPTEILATDDPAATPQGWTWLVSFKLTTLDNRPVAYSPFYFHAPAEQVVDLTTVAPVTSCNGVAITRGNDGVSPVDFTVSGTHLNIRLSDGSTHTVELPVLDPENTTVINGKDGRGITSVAQSGITLTLNYSDGTSSEPITIPTVAGERGPEGLQGPPGATGKSAYEIALEQGFVGSEAQWLASLKGEAGKDAVAPAYDDTEVRQIATDAYNMALAALEENASLASSRPVIYVQETTPTDPQPGELWVW